MTGVLIFGLVLLFATAGAMENFRLRAKGGAESYVWYGVMWSVLAGSSGLVLALLI